MNRGRTGWVQHTELQKAAHWGRKCALSIVSNLTEQEANQLRISALGIDDNSVCDHVRSSAWDVSFECIGLRTPQTTWDTREPELWGAEARQ